MNSQTMHVRSVGHTSRIIEYKKPYTYELGPFTVLCEPNAHGLYHRYTILANGVPVRKQISIPEEADGWCGLSTIRASRETRDFNEKELDDLAAFYTPNKSRLVRVVSKQEKKEEVGSDV